MFTEGVRLAQVSDLDRLAELADLSRRELLASRAGAFWALRRACGGDPRRHLAGLLASQGHGAAPAIVECGTIDDVVVGFAAARVEPLADGHRLCVLGQLYVEPGAREVGVGEAMLRAVIAWAERQGCAGIEGAVPPGYRAGKNLFERLGLTARSITVYKPLEGGAQGDA